MNAVKNTLIYPYSAIGLVKSTNEDGTFGYCTGFIIADSIVLTANHCAKKKYKELSFIPGYTQTGDGFDEWEVGAVIRNKRYSERDVFDAVSSDYMFLLFGKAGGKTLGEIYGVIDFATRFYQGQPVKAIGYPLDELVMTESPGKVVGITRRESACIKLYPFTGKVDCKTNNLTIEAVMKKGNSGGPLLDERNRVISVASAINETNNAFYPVLIDNPYFINDLKFAQDYFN